MRPVSIYTQVVFFLLLMTAIFTLVYDRAKEIERKVYDTGMTVTGGE